MIIITFDIEAISTSLTSTTHAQIAAVNDAGVAVGCELLPVAGSFSERAIILDGPAKTVINPPGAVMSWATDINKSGDVVGGFMDASGATLGFYRKANGTFVILQGLPGDIQDPIFFTPRLNNSGVVVGSCKTGGLRHAVQWKPLTASGGTAQDLHTAPWFQSAADDINDAGAVVGHVTQDIGGPAARISVALNTAGLWMPIAGLDNVFSPDTRISDTGAVAGYAIDVSVSPSVPKAFLLAGGSIQTITDPAGAEVIPRDMSRTGLPVVGNILDRSVVPNTSRAFVFNAQGLADLSTLIGPNTGWDLQTASMAAAVSPNGNFIVGMGSFGGLRLFRITRHIIDDKFQPSGPPSPPAPHEWAIQILFGGRAGGAGVAVGPDGRPIPIPPRGDIPRLTVGMPGVLSALASHELASQVADPATRRRLQPELLRQAGAQLEAMAKMAERGPRADGGGAAKPLNGRAVSHLPKPRKRRAVK